jgi:hypothetical protein
MPQPHVRKSIVQGTLSNNRAGMAVLLDTVKSFDYIDHEVRSHFENMNELNNLCNSLMVSEVLFQISALIVTQ